MDRMSIVGGRPLNGTIAISGAKNAALPLMIAGLLTPERLTLKNVPSLADVALLGRILRNHGVDLTIDYLRRSGPALVFSNLVDFDSKYGHRNDPEGYAHAIEALDVRIPELVGALGGGLLLLTGDHGCDPTPPSPDHSRERTPMLAAGLPAGPFDVGDRATYADLGATAAELLGVRWDLAGSSFAGELGL